MSDDTMHKAFKRRRYTGGNSIVILGWKLLEHHNERPRRYLADVFQFSTRHKQACWYDESRRRGSLLEASLIGFRRYLAESWFEFLERPVLLLWGELSSPLWCY